MFEVARTLAIQETMNALSFERILGFWDYLIQHKSVCFFMFVSAPYLLGLVSVSLRLWKGLELEGEMCACSE